MINIMTLESKFSGKKTADWFESIIKRKGLILFFRIDHKKHLGCLLIIKQSLFLVTLKLVFY